MVVQNNPTVATESPPHEDRPKPKPARKHRMHPNSLANLTPPQKGAPSFNPSGPKPKPKQIPWLLQKIGKEKVDYQGGRISKLEAIMRAVFNFGLQGHAWAVQFIADRTEGKPQEKTEIQHKHTYTYDLSKLGRDELEQLRTIIAKAAPAQPGRDRPGDGATKPEGVHSPALAAGRNEPIR